MKVLGIDFGLKKIGLALTEGYLAEPLEVLIVKEKKEKAIQKISSFCEEEKIDKIVIGLPESGLVKKIKKFGEELKRITSLPVIYQPETLTTRDAFVKMKEAGLKRENRKKKEDAVAAALILQSWLEKNYV